MCGEDSGQMSTGRHLLLVTAREVVRKCDTCHVTTALSQLTRQSAGIWKLSCGNTLLIFGTKYERKFVPDDRKTH